SATPAGFPRQPGAGTVANAGVVCNRRLLPDETFRIGNSGTREIFASQLLSSKFHSCSRISAGCKLAALSLGSPPMKASQQKRALNVAIKAAQAAGALMKKNFHLPKKV